MMVSPFTFYRGAAKIMAADLADTPVAGLDAQLCGDAHLSNFGLFASLERRLLFDLNDFNETLPGSFEYDVRSTVAETKKEAKGAKKGKKDEKLAKIAEKRAEKSWSATHIGAVSRNPRPTGRSRWGPGSQPRCEAGHGHPGSRRHPQVVPPWTQLHPFWVTRP